jgi:hypothetical protein
MRTNKVILFFLLPGILLLQTCKKVHKEMLVSTGNVTNILITTADVSGQILDIGDGATICGHCFATTTNPTVSGMKTEIASPVLGKYTSNLTGLSASTKYYVRAYLSRGSEVVYGSDTSFTTLSNDPPVLTTKTVTDILQTTAISGGNISSQGGTSVTARGICWSLATGPTIVNSKTSDGSGTGSFSSSMTDLSAGTKYYVRAYATNEGDTGYGNEVNFTTQNLASLPVVTTAAVISITSGSAISGGEVTSGTGVDSRGVCWNTTGSPTTSDNKTTDGSGTGSFISSLTNLTPGTTYYIRAYAHNSAGTSYADAIYEYSFTTCKAPLATTDAATDLIATNATINGTVNANNSATTNYTATVTFEYGTTTSYGNTKTAVQSPITGSTNNAVSAGIAGLSSNTLYHYRVKATNCGGTVYGSDMTFTSLALVTTTALSSITSTSASSGGTIEVGGGANISAKGVCWSTSADPTTSNSKTSDGTGVGTFTSSLTGLTIGTTYYIRAYATNIAGTAYGNQIIYVSVVIGNSYQGGIVAYILQSGNPGYDASMTHGLIAAPSDQSTGIVWWNGSYLFAQAAGSAIGSGMYDTEAIIYYQGTGSYAASLCKNLSLGGFTDWYLPSRDELNELYLNRVAIGGFANNYYWSSTESSNLDANAQNFTNGSQSYFADKKLTNYVRAIRSF